MTLAEHKLIERFLQYGGLKTSELIFMGYEEGLANLPKLYGSSNSVAISVEARRLLHSDPIYKNCRIYINGVNDKDGWYIDESNWNFPNDHAPLTHAIYKAIGNLGLNKNWLPPTVNVINMQTRFHWLLEASNRITNYTKHKETKYNELNLHARKHMIDFYPLPKQGKGSSNWVQSHHSFGQINNHKKYYDYYNNQANPRGMIISNLYDLLPMNITVSYLGKRSGRFRLHSFYSNIGFANFITHNTGVINPAYNGPILPSSKGKDFIIGKRIRPRDGHQQILVLTPFLGMGQLSYDDIDAISTWL